MNTRLIAHMVVGAAVVIGFFVVLGIMLWRDRIGTELLVGSLCTAFGLVVGYYYGSSAGSERKTDLLAKANPVDPR